MNFHVRKRWNGAVRITGYVGSLLVLIVAFSGCGSLASDGSIGSSCAGAYETVGSITSDDAVSEMNMTDHAAAEQDGKIADAYARLNIVEDYRNSFDHGSKGPEFQKYIVIHDTEGESAAASVVDWWESNNNLIAAHFVVDKDGSIVQCVNLDSIAHHAGFGDTGHNAMFGVEDESRDDKLGTKAIGSWASDYGMNSYSIGIELVHVGGAGDYPQAQLDALDNLIAYIDAYYGFESEIIDHKTWRSGNSDTSPEFAIHLESYNQKRHHA